MIHSLLARNYDRECFDVYVACNQGSRAAPSSSLVALSAMPGLTVVPVNFGPTMNARRRREVAADVVKSPMVVWTLLRLALYARRHKIRIIHGTEKPRDAFYGVILGRLSGARTVVHVHVKFTRAYSRLVRWAMGHADALIGVSRFVQGSLQDMGYAPEKTHYVVNALDTTGWDPATSGGGIREEFGIPADAPLLTIISRLFRWKGHGELLRALALVVKDVPDVHLLIVGEDDARGDSATKPYSAQLQQLTCELGLESNVSFAGFRSDVAAILAAADIFAMPTFEEPCAVAFLEAMAMAKPIIALASGGTPELVDDGLAGLLSAPGDIEALAANITLLACDRPMQARMGAYGRRRVEEYYTPERMADEVAGIYQSLVTPEGPRTTLPAASSEASGSQAGH